MMAMTPKAALDHFKSKTRIARVLGVEPPSVFEWFSKGKIPEGRQYQLQIASDGALRADKPANRLQVKVRRVKPRV